MTADRSPESDATADHRSTTCAWTRDEVNRLARVLMDEWQRSEGAPVGSSYVATFADMARALLANQYRATHPGAGRDATRLYIAGPISADPSRTFEEKWAAFDIAAERLAAAGYEAVPATGIDPDCGLTPEACTAQQKHVSASQGGGKHSWECYMKADLRELLTCDGVALLRGWQMSPGARIEFTTAVAVGIEARDVDEWVDLVSRPAGSGQ